MGEVQAETALQKPAIPEFTLRFVDNSYDVPPTFSKDPFTGKNEMTQEGYHVENKTIEVKIKNQSFNRYVDSQGNHIMLQYDIRWKGHFDGYWVEYSSHNNGIYLGASNQIMVDGSLLYPNAPYTEATYIIGTNRYEGQFAFGYDGRLGNVSDGGKIDFQVQALIGYYNSIEVPPDSVYPRGNIQTVFTGVSSDWSKTQAITIGVSSDDTPNQNEPTPSPTFTADRPPQSEITIAGFSLFEFSLGVIIGAVISGLSIALVYEKRKTAKQKG
jgi:hypothetical protein